MTQAQVVMKNLTIKKGQEYRAYDAQYTDSVKYLWLTAKDKNLWSAKTSHICRL